MFELHIEETTVDSSRIKVGWCLDKELINKIANLGQEAYLLLVTCTKEGRFENRKVVPLIDMIAFLDVRHPGENVVLGKIILGKINRVHDVFLARNRHNYFTDIIARDEAKFLQYEAIRDYWEEFSALNCKLGDASLNINVPEEVFAKAPPLWEQRWVNRLWREKPFDQCNYRRRRIFAYTIQPILYILACVALFAHKILMLLALARTGSSILDILKDPFQMPSIDGHYSIEFFNRVFKLEDKEHPGAVLPGAAITPLALGFGALVIHTTIKTKWLTSLLLAPVGVLGIACAFGIMALLIWGGVTLFEDFWIFKKMAGFIDRFIDRIYIYFQNEPIIPDLELLEPLTCDGIPKLDISKMPKKNKSIRLKFEAFKTKVCRPFAG